MTSSRCQPGVIADSIANQVLVAQLGNDSPAGHAGMRRRADVAETAAGPAGHTRQARGLVCLRDTRRPIAMLEWRDHGHHIDRHVDRAGHRRHFGRGQCAARVNSIRNYDERAPMRAPVADLAGGFRHRVVQRRHAGRGEVPECAANLIVVGRERGLAANGSIERKERHFVSTRFHPTQQMLHDAFASLQVGIRCACSRSCRRGKPR